MTTTGWSFRDSSSANAAPARPPPTTTALDLRMVYRATLRQGERRGDLATTVCGSSPIAVAVVIAPLRTSSLPLTNADIPMEQVCTTPHLQRVTAELDTVRRRWIAFDTTHCKRGQK